MILNKDNDEFMPENPKLRERIWWTMFFVGVVLYNFWQFLTLLFNEYKIVMDH
jgi:hypothetical protein